MQIPSNDVRPLAEGERVLDDEVELDADQAARVLEIQQRLASDFIKAEAVRLDRQERQERLAARPHRSKSAKRRNR